MIRYRPNQRVFAWLAFMAMGLAALMPVVSQLAMHHAVAMAGATAAMEGMDGMAMDAMADMGADCPGHMGHVDSAQGTHPDDAGHAGMSLDACGYCSLMAHFGGLPPLPVVVMRPPAPDAGAPLAAYATPPRAAPWLFDAAPRGPPDLT